MIALIMMRYFVWLITSFKMMVFALEPKIVIPGVGPVGIENSWAVTPEGVEKLTICNEEIIELQ